MTTNSRSQEAMLGPVNPGLAPAVRLVLVAIALQLLLLVLHA